MRNNVRWEWNGARWVLFVGGKKMGWVSGYFLRDGTPGYESRVGGRYVRESNRDNLADACLFLVNHTKPRWKKKQPKTWDEG